MPIASASTPAPLLDYTIEVDESGRDLVPSSSQADVEDVDSGDGREADREGAFDFYNDYFVDYRRNGMVPQLLLLILPRCFSKLRVVDSPNSPHFVPVEWGATVLTPPPTRTVLLHIFALLFLPPLPSVAYPHCLFSG